MIHTMIKLDSKWTKIAKQKIAQGENVNMNTVGSTNIAAVGYNESQALMQVDFLDGSRYQYFQVPMVLYEKVLYGRWTAKYPTPHSPSVGAALHHYLKTVGFAYRKIY